MHIEINDVCSVLRTFPHIDLYVLVCLCASKSCTCVCVGDLQLEDHYVKTTKPLICFKVRGYSPSVSLLLFTGHLVTLC